MHHPDSVFPPVMMEPNTFSAVYVSRKPFYSGGRFFFRKVLLGWDCTFRYYPGGAPVTLRIHKDNPILEDLKPNNVYRFQGFDPLGFRRHDGTVTDLKTARIYQLVK